MENYHTPRPFFISFILFHITLDTRKALMAYQSSAVHAIWSQQPAFRNTNDILTSDRWFWKPQNIRKWERALLIKKLQNAYKMHRETSENSLRLQNRCDFDSRKSLRIGVNSYWAKGLKPPPTFMIMGLAYMTSPPTFVTWCCLNCVSIVRTGFTQCRQIDS